MISFSRLCTDLSFGPARGEVDGTEIDKFGRGWPTQAAAGSDAEFDGECCEMEPLPVPWLEIEGLRERADESSCESDCDCESDLWEVSTGYAIQK